MTIVRFFLIFVAAESKEALQMNGLSMFSKIHSVYNDDMDIIDITMRTEQNLASPADYESEDSAEDVPSSEDDEVDDDDEDES